MSKSRLATKLRQNHQYPAIVKWLDERGLTYVLVQPEGNSKAHPWLLIDLPTCADPVRFSISSTPKPGVPITSAIGFLKRKLRTHGYDC